MTLDPLTLVMGLIAAAVLAAAIYWWRAAAGQRRIAARLSRRLADEQRRRDEIINGTQAGTWEWNVKTGETVFSPRWAEISGYDLEDLEPVNIYTWRDLTHPGDVKRCNELLEDSLAGRINCYECETRVRHKSGRWIWVLDRGQVVEWTEGNQPLRVCGTRQDIDQRKQAELSLQQAEGVLHTALDAASDGIWDYEVATGQARVNRRSLEMFGFEPEKANPRSDEIFSRVHPDDLPEVQKALQDHAAGLTPNYSCQFRVSLPDGATRWVLGRGRVIEWDDRGRAQRMIGTNIDITAWKQTQEALGRSERKYRELFNSISDLIYTQDMEGRFLSSNAAIHELFGFSMEEFLGRKATDFMDPEMESLFTSEYLRDIREKGKHEGISKYYRKDGSSIYLEYRSELVQPEEGEPYISGLARDVTDRVRAEGERKKLESQLRQAQKMEAVGTLAGGIAHDFNNLLAIISGFSELALDDARTGRPCLDKIEPILQAADRGRELVQQILTFSRKAAFELRPLDINSVISDTAKIIDRTIPKMIAVRLRLKDGLPPVNGNAGQIEQILLNLANNAKDAMPEGGALTMETGAVSLDEEYANGHLGVSPGEYVLVTVSDTGRGLDSDALEHIFDPFYTTKDVGKGTGLGLASVYGAIKTHQGHIVCYSEPDRGTSFKIYLPAIRSAEAGPEEKSAAGEGAGGAETILLVDDEAAIRDLGRHILTRRGYRVVAAESGEQALEVYRSQGPEIDLVILDINMPGMGGQRCLQELLGLDPRVKVIIASGYSREGLPGDTLDSGAAAFVPKPFSGAELLRTIREILDND